MYESELLFTQDMLRERISPPSSASSKGERIRAAARALGWKYSRVESFWYADERVAVKPRELRQIEETTGVTFRATQREIRTNDDLIAKAESLLAGNEAAFYSAFIAALRAMARASDRS